MAQSYPCDICGQEEAVQTLTNNQTGDVMLLGAACLPVFYGNMTLQLFEAGDHKGPAGKCQACRRVHEHMQTPVAAIDVQSEPATDTASAQTPAADTKAETS